VQLELLAALFKASCVIKGNAALPMIGRPCWHQLYELVKVGNGFLEVAEFEVLAAAVLPGVGQAGIELDDLIVIGDGLRRLTAFFVNRAR